METTTVYRIEHRWLPDNPGPYNRSVAFADLQDLAVDLGSAHGRSEDHPPPNCDRGIGWRFQEGYHYCATKDYAGLKRWFRGFGKRLKANGFVVRVYVTPVSSAAFSEKTDQVVFDRAASVRRASFAISFN